MDGVTDDSFRIIGVDREAMELKGRPPVNYWQDAWRRFKENKIALVAFIILSILIIMMIIGPGLSGHAFEKMNTAIRNTPPTAANWFGTDELGRDIFARVWVAGRVSIVIGLIGAFVSSFLGTLYGGVSAYCGGKVDAVMMRIVEILMSIPYLIIVILIMVITDSKSLGTLILALTITGWCNIARIVRGQVLQLKNQEFVMAARALGVKPFKILTRHLIPNTLGVIIVAITFDIPGYIFAEAFLSYIGLGIQPPNTSLGALASAAQQRLIFYPYQLFFPSMLIALMMLCFTLFGDGLRDALDPKLRK